MAHNLSTKDGEVTMMYVGQKPWHGLGTRLDKPATAQEAIKAAHLDWTVEKQPIFLENGKTIPRKYAIVRTDTQHALGIVGGFYKPLQNNEAFSFFDAIVGIKAAMYHTAGALGHGEKIWILAKLPNDIVVKGHDVINNYLLLVNTHDGSMPVTVMFTPIRVVCENTLNVAVTTDNMEKKATVRHTVRLPNHVKDVREYLGIVNQMSNLIEQAFQRLAEKPLNTTVQFNDYIKQVFDWRDSELTGQQQTKLNVLTRLFEEGRGNDMPSIKHTWWAAFNAVTEYVDYYYPIRASKKPHTESVHAQNVLFGYGARLKQRALDVALTLA